MQCCMLRALLKTCRKKNIALLSCELLDHIRYKPLDWVPLDKLFGSYWAQSMLSAAPLAAFIDTQERLIY